LASSSCFFMLVGNLFQPGLAVLLDLCSLQIRLGNPVFDF